MTAREQAHLALLQKLNDVLGPEHAATLMAPYFTVDWSSLATRDDLLLTGQELRGEMQELRSELRGEMQELRGEMQELRSEVRGEMQDLRVEMHRGFAVQSRVFVLSLVMAVVAMTSVFLAAG